jgi:acyl carrier protein
MNESALHENGEVPDLEVRLRRLMADQTGGAVSWNEIELDTPILGRGIGLSSLDTVSFMIRIENEFDLFLEAEEFAQSLESFGSLLEAVRRKIEAAATTGESHAF